MAVKEGKSRITISLETDLLEIIKQNAKKNQRTTSSEIAYMLLNGIKIDTTHSSKDK